MSLSYLLNYRIIGSKVVVLKFLVLMFSLCLCNNKVKFIILKRENMLSLLIRFDQGTKLELCKLIAKLADADCDGS